MPMCKLDAAFCAAAECPTRKKKVDYWDKELKGFVLEVRPSGGKTYCLRYTDENGRQKQVKIGGWSDITFAAAKKRAQRLRSEVVMGGDPLATKKRKRAVPLYAELAQQHIDHAKTYQKRPENTEAVINGHLVPQWGKLRLDEITEQEIARWLAEKRKTLAPATVEKLRMMLGRTYELGGPPLNRPLPPSDVVAIGKLENLESEPIHFDPNDLLGHGWFSANFHVSHVEVGDLPKTVVPVRYFGHTWFREEVRFRFRLRPDEEGGYIVCKAPNASGYNCD